MLVLADVVGLVLAFVTVELLFVPAVQHASAIRMKDLLLSIISLPLWIVIAKLYRLYDQDEERTHHSTSDDIVGVFHVVTIGTWLTFVVLSLSGLADPSLEKAIGLWISAILFITLARTIARTICRRNLLYLQNTLIVGAGDVGQLRRPQAPAAPRVRLQPRRLRRLASRRSAMPTSGIWRCSVRPTSSRSSCARSTSSASWSRSRTTPTTRRWRRSGR